MLSESEIDALQGIETSISLISIVCSVLTLINHYNNRKKKRRNLMSRQVMVLCCIDLLVAFLLAIGPAAAENEGFCKFQALFLQCGFISNILWNAVIAFQTYRLITLKKSEDRLMKNIKKLAIYTSIVAVIISLVLLGLDTYGDATVYCWIKADPAYDRFFGFFIFLFLSWIFVIVRLMSVSESIRRQDANEALAHSAESAIRRKLFQYAAIFVFVWFFPLLDRIAEAAAGEPVFGTSVLHALILPCQGILDSVMYGGLLGDDSILWTLFPSGVDLVLTATTGKPSMVMSRRRSSIMKTRLVDAPIKYTPRKLSIFSTSFNQGEALFPDIGDLGVWIKPGHDIYAIGVQECMCVDEFKAALLALLGGPDKYTMYSSQIGSSNTRLGFHGFIALFVLVRTSDVERGVVKLVESSSKDVASGANLLVTTAANKGAVGLLFHIHDTSIGFVTAHLPSDSKGKSKLPRRNATARDILRELILAADDTGCDVQLQHDHLIFMGDLNYRMNNPPGFTGLTMLQSVVEASIVEKNCLNNDSNWVAFKYRRMYGRDMPEFPTQEEIDLIDAAAKAAAPAWDFILLQDEMREMMAAGEVYNGFDEPPPRFPPTYKRKKGLVEASCGDYTDLPRVLSGFSHIGEELVTSATTEEGEDISATRKSISETTAPHLASISEAGGDESSSTDQAKTLSDNEARAIAVAAAASIVTPPSSPTTPASPSRPRSRLRNSILGPIFSEPVEEQPSTEGGSGLPTPPAMAPMTKKKSKRASIVSLVRSPEAIAAAEEAKAKSKIRPPSYTDRILTYSLPDRKNRLSVTAYDFCDDIRASDHRPVCMALTVETNSEVLPSIASASSPSAGAGKPSRRVSARVPDDCVLAMLEISELNVDIMNPGGSLMNPLQNAGAGTNAYLSPDMDTSDTTAVSDSSNSPNVSTLPRLPNDPNSRDLEAGQDSGVSGAQIEDTAIAEVIVIFPLPCKDPMSSQRKLFDFARALDLGTGDTNRLARPAVNTLPWSATALGPIEVDGYVSPQLGIHVLLKLVNKSGVDLGQCVVALTHLAFAEVEDSVDAEVALTSGGQARGLLRGHFKLKRALGDSGRKKSTGGK